MLKYGVRNAFRNAFWPSVFGTFLLPWKLRRVRVVPVPGKVPVQYCVLFTHTLTHGDVHTCSCGTPPAFTARPISQQARSRLVFVAQSKVGVHRIHETARSLLRKFVALHPTSRLSHLSRGDGQR